MSQRLDVKGVIPAHELCGDDDHDTELLREMLEGARTYLKGHPWCPRIVREYFGYGVGGVIAVFLFELEKQDDCDTWLWVVFGDVPSAYLVTDQAPDPLTAVSVYCDLMEEWAAAVLAGGSVANAFPVDSSPTKENAKALLSRTRFVKERLLPQARARES